MLVVNTKSRSGKEAFEAAREALAARGVPLLGSHALSSPERMPRVLHEAMAAGVRRILVGGGDGTLSCAVATCSAAT